MVSQSSLTLLLLHPALALTLALTQDTRLLDLTQGWTQEDFVSVKQHNQHMITSDLRLSSTQPLKSWERRTAN